MERPPSPEDTTRSRRSFLTTTAAAGIAGIAGCLDDGPGEADGTEPSEEFTVETVAEGFDHPWGLELLPDSGLLVTERSGQLARLDRESGTVETIDGTPDVLAAGQGGLLDVAVHPDYPADAWVYLTYAAANDHGESTTHVGRGLLDPDDSTLVEFEPIHIAEPFVDSTGHYGSRVLFGEDDLLYVTVGDRQFGDFGPDHVSQDRTNELGTTLRLTPDGSIPEHNPFVDDTESCDSIFSYGHRNTQGMAVHPDTGRIWQSEHGEQDGDELNVLERGGNYGWPITHYGCEYGTGAPIGEQPHDRDDVVDPVYYWECNTGGFPPAGATFYDSGAFPDWEGDLFVGNLAGQYLGRFAVDGRDVDELDPLLDGRGWRIRDVEDAPDTGALYVAVDAADAPIVRLLPE